MPKLRSTCGGQIPLNKELQWFSGCRCGDPRYGGMYSGGIIPVFFVLIFAQLPPLSSCLKRVLLIMSSYVFVVPRPSNHLTPNDRRCGDSGLCEVSLYVISATYTSGECVHVRTLHNFFSRTTMRNIF